MSERSRTVNVTASKVDILGLRDFIRALNEVSDKYPGMVRDANIALAREIIKRSKLRAKKRGGVANKAAKSLRAGRAAASAVVSGGGGNYPFFFGAEFGAKQYKQFDYWRGNQWRGWAGGPGIFLHPTIRQDADSLIDEYVKRLDELYSEAFGG